MPGASVYLSSLLFLSFFKSSSRQQSKVQPCLLYRAVTITSKKKQRLTVNTFSAIKLHIHHETIEFNKRYLLLLSSNAELWKIPVSNLLSLNRKESFIWRWHVIFLSYLLSLVFLFISLFFFFFLFFLFTNDKVSSFFSFSHFLEKSWEWGENME